MDTSSTKETNQPRPSFFHDLDWDKTCFFVSLFRAIRANHVWTGGALTSQLRT